jgi:hypothetical protein
MPYLDQALPCPAQPLTCWFKSLHARPRLCLARADSAVSASESAQPGEGFALHNPDPALQNRDPALHGTDSGQPGPAFALPGPVYSVSGTGSARPRIRLPRLCLTQVLNETVSTRRSLGQAKTFPCPGFARPRFGPSFSLTAHIVICPAQVQLGLCSDQPRPCPPSPVSNLPRRAMPCSAKTLLSPVQALPCLAQFLPCPA